MKGAGGKAALAKAALGLGLGLALLAAPEAGADEEREPTVAEEILRILRDQGDISEERYRALAERARGERERREASDVAAAPDSSWKVHWKDGARIERRDGAFEFRIGGRLMNDWAFFDPDDGLERFFGEDDLDGNGTEFRRARLFVSGLLWEWVAFKAQYDFAGGDAELKDAYLRFTRIPGVGNVQVGHFKEPFSLEELTSSKYITFMERSIANAFSPGRNVGVALHDHALGERMTWAVGAFRDADDFGEGFDDEARYNVTARVTGLPWYAEEGRKLLHLGLSYSHRFRESDDASVRLRSRPEAHLSPVRFADTGSFASDDLDLVNPELALVLGPFSLQAEYFRAFADTSSGRDPELSGHYVEASWFLTGEHRSYETDAGSFGRVTPERSFSPTGGGPGAWQVALRYSGADLEDGGLLGGELTNYGAGLNWHLNRNVRAMLNYIRSELESDATGADGRAGVDDAANLFQARFQVDF